MNNKNKKKERSKLWIKKRLITFYIGTLDGDTHKQELSLNYFKQVLDDTFDCYTLSKCYGRYKHNNGTVVNELTLKVKYLDYDNILNIKKRVQDSGYYLIKNALW